MIWILDTCDITNFAAYSRAESHIKPVYIENIAIWRNIDVFKFWVVPYRVDSLHVTHKSLYFRNYVTERKEISSYSGSCICNF